MRKLGTVVPVVAGLLAVSGPIRLCAVQAQTPTPFPPAASETKPSTRTIELRILSPDGKVTARVFPDIEKGQPLSFFSNRVTYSQDTNNGTRTLRLEGNVIFKTKRNGSEMTLLQAERDDAIVEYIITRNKSVAPPSLAPK